MAYEHHHREATGAVGLITLNRPQALNALNAPADDGAAAGARRPSRPTTRSAAIVLTGSEKAFAAGADIKEMKDKTFIDVLPRGLHHPRVGARGDAAASR